MKPSSILLMGAIALLVYVLMGGSLSVDGLSLNSQGLERILNSVVINVGEMMEGKQSVEFAKQYGYTEEKGNMTAVLFSIVLLAISVFATGKR